MCSYSLPVRQSRMEGSGDVMRMSWICDRVKRQSEEGAREERGCRVLDNVLDY